MAVGRGESMTAVLKMNRHRQINLPSAFVARLSLGDDRYFKADIEGNRIVLTPVDPVERIFSEEDLELVEAAYQRQRGSGKPVTSDWIRKTHGLR